MATTIFAVLSLAFWLNLASAQSNLTTESTRSDGRVGWTAPEGRRSILGIIWSCLSIFLVCSWKCVHLNVPTPEESRGGWKKFRLWKWQVPYWPKPPLRAKWRRKISWMVLISIAPEFGVGVAAHEWLEARETLREVNRDDLSMAHAFYANMGGILCRVISTNKHRPEKEEELHPQLEVIPAPRDVEQPKSMDLRYDRSPTWHKVEREYVAKLGVLSLPGVISDMTEEQIHDRSKSDAFTKIFAIVQSLWLVLQSIARAVNGLAISELELATMAFVACALVMYLFWWDKPFGVEERHEIIQILPLPEEGTAKHHHGKVSYEGHEFCHPGERVTQLDSEFRAPDLLFPGQDNLLHKDNLTAIAFNVTGMAFSGIHLAAWNWEFPTNLIQTLWRAFALTAFVRSIAPVIFWHVVPIVSRVIPSRSSFDLTDLAAYILYFLLFSYVFSRIAVLFLIIYCFSSMPASVYEEVDWMAFIPHFS
ncbi:hypothetical protein B0H63DRAFT_468447 [Podospora didyma]|uniref:Uncharacterized protein n=1 Tax=Podospora didyma TaxID=330526 RepID=A0AAE0U186_9PEZI|nr:hypothetical protein B0H63DRAFT_468447 [Podospora didyma]